MANNTSLSQTVELITKLRNIIQKLSNLEDSEVTGEGNCKLLLQILNSINGLRGDLDSWFDKLVHELASKLENKTSLSMAHMKMELQTEVKDIYDKLIKLENQKISMSEIDGDVSELANQVRALENNPIPIQTDDKSAIGKVVL